MQVIVTDTRMAVVSALRKTLDHLQIAPALQVSIEVHHGPVEVWDAPGVCFVNGGNSVGVMDGQLDTCLKRLVPGAEQDVVGVIRKFGDVARDGTRHLPMFSALLSPSVDNTRFLLTSPCTYLPGPGDMRGTRNAFHSTHVALSMVREAARSGVKIHRVVMTGMCTGRGRTNRDESAKQMTDAFRAVFIDNNMVVDAEQAKHPRLMRNPLYPVQPVREEHDVFQPLHAHITASGEWEMRAPPVVPPKQIRSGGSQEQSPFINLK